MYCKLQESLKDNSVFGSLRSIMSFQEINRIKIKFYKEIDEIENNINILWVGRSIPTETINIINSKINNQPIITIGHNCQYESVTLNFIDVIDKNGLDFVTRHSLNRADLEKKGLNYGNILNGMEVNTKEIANEQELNDALAFLSKLNSSEKDKSRPFYKILIIK